MSTPEQVHEFMTELLALCRRHNAGFSACSCCNGVNADIAGAEVTDLQVDPEEVTWRDSNYDHMEIK